MINFTQYGVKRPASQQWKMACMFYRFTPNASYLILAFFPVLINIEPFANRNDRTIAWGFISISFFEYSVCYKSKSR